MSEAQRLIVNASPLVFLGNAGRLELLRELGGGRIEVPAVVLREVTESKHRDRASTAVAAASWIAPHDEARVPLSVARWNLDVGEEQVVAAAIAAGDARVVLDDLAGRKCALAHQLDVIGTLGVAVAAYRRGLIDDVEALLGELRQGGMWLSPSVIANVLALVRASE
ncbi:MAG: DUF3368 domain-containing protein [Myxococcota bacterium]